MNQKIKAIIELHCHRNDEKMMQYSTFVLSNV